MFSKQTAINEEGTTLVETLVAMTILVSVLLPSGLFVAYIATNPINKQKMLALGIAEVEMESILNSKKYVSNRTEKDKWIIESAISEAYNLLQIRVSVYRRTNPDKSIVTLTTERIVNEDAPH